MEEGGAWVEGKREAPDIYLAKSGNLPRRAAPLMTNITCRREVTPTAQGTAGAQFSIT